MATNYYKHKVFVRAEGILKTCIIPEYKYAWGNDTDLLVFFIPREIPDTTVQKAAQYMKSAFRKARVDVGPVFENRLARNPDANRFIRTIAIRFNKDAIIKKEGANV
jgi:hypothetical protein